MKLGRERQPRSLARPLLGLAALFIALLALDRALDARYGARAQADNPPRELLPAAQRRDMTVAAVSFEQAETGERFVYAQREGVWRCMNAYGALALTPAVTALTSTLAGAVGELRTDDPARQKEFGFDGAGMLTVGLHGPRVLEDSGGDRLAAFDLGLALPGIGEGRAFVRPAGTSEVFEIGSNPRALLERPSADRMPPLLDRRVMAGDFPGPGEGVVRAFIDWPDGEALELFLREVPPAEVLPGRSAREWVAVRAGEEAICLPFRVAGWQGFVFRVGYVGFADPARRAEYGFEDGPVVRITLFVSDGTATALSVGARIPGGAFVLNEKTGMLCLVAPEHVALFAPTIQMLCEPEGPNPWEAWLSGAR